MNRRGFLRDLGFAACAPAIVRVASIMPVRSLADLNGEIIYPLYGRSPGMVALADVRELKMLIASLQTPPIQWFKLRAPT